MREFLFGSCWDMKGQGMRWHTTVQNDARDSRWHGRTNSCSSLYWACDSSGEEAAL